MPLECCLHTFSPSFPDKKETTFWMPHFTGSQTRLSREKFYLSDSGCQDGRETFRRLFPFSDLINPQLKSNITCSKTKVTPLPQTVTVWGCECKVWQDSKTIWFLSSVRHHRPTPAREQRWRGWEKKRGRGAFWRSSPQTPPAALGVLTESPPRLGAPGTTRAPHHLEAEAAGPF